MLEIVKHELAKRRASGEQSAYRLRGSRNTACTFPHICARRKKAPTRWLESAGSGLSLADPTRAVPGVGASIKSPRTVSKFLTTICRTYRRLRFRAAGWRTAARDDRARRAAARRCCGLRMGNSDEFRHRTRAHARF